MTVIAHDRHTGLANGKLRRHDMHDPLTIIAQIERGHAVRGHVLGELPQHRRTARIGRILGSAAMRRGIVIGESGDLTRPADLQIPAS